MHTCILLSRVILESRVALESLAARPAHPWAVCDQHLHRVVTNICIGSPTIPLLPGPADGVFKILFILRENVHREPFTCTPHGIYFRKKFLEGGNAVDMMLNEFKRDPYAHKLREESSQQQQQASHGAEGARCRGPRTSACPRRHGPAVQLASSWLLDGKAHASPRDP